MQRFGPPPAYPHLKIPGLNTTFQDPNNSFYMKQNDDEEVNKLVSNMYGGFSTYENNQDIDKGMWGEMKKDEEYSEDEYDEGDTGIENEVTEMRNFDLSHVGVAGDRTGFTSGFE